MNPALHNAADLEKIAELEAELASERTLAETAWRANADLVAANEKAEAEVERLTADLETALKIIKGGGRESGAATQERVRLSSAAEAAAAANPAAPNHDEGNPFCLCWDCSITRKGRDER